MMCGALQGSTIGSAAWQEEQRQGFSVAAVWQQASLKRHETALVNNMLDLPPFICIKDSTELLLICCGACAAAAAARCVLTW